MFKQLIDTIASYFFAYNTIRRKPILAYVVVLSIINLLFFIKAVAIYIHYQATFINFIISKLNAVTWLHNQTYASSFWGIVTLIIVQFIILLYCLNLVSTALSIVVAPVHYYLLKKVHLSISANLFTVWVKVIINNIQLLLWYTLYTIAMLLICSVPILGWVTPLVLLVLQGYYYGNNNFYLAALLYEQSTTTFSQYISHYKGYLIGNGIYYYLLLFIPIIGWAIAPFISVFAAYKNYTYTAKL